MSTEIKSIDYVLEANRLIQLALETQPEWARNIFLNRYKGGTALLVAGDSPYPLVCDDKRSGRVLEIRPTPKSMKRHDDRLRRGEGFQDSSEPPARDPRQNN